MNISLDETNNIVTCASYSKKPCYYGRHCKFLHCSHHLNVINNQQTPHDELNRNNEKHFRKQQQQQKKLINNQQVELKEKLTQLLKQESKNVTNNHDQHIDINNFNSNIIKHNKNRTKKRTRSSNKQQASKILNIIYSNARGIKSQTKSIKEILFETQITRQNRYHNRTTRKHKS